MVGTALQRRLNWIISELVEVIDETPRVRSLVFSCPGWPGHLPGQHVDVRLTAEDGYQAQRSYSISTPEDGELITITVERVDDGEVSPFLIDGLNLGDRIEIRGPIGGYFVWEPALGGPVQLIGGGTGVAPLMAILRSRVTSGSDIPMRYLGSARTHEDVLYSSELEQLGRHQPDVIITHTLTRSHPDGWAGPTRRVDRDMLEELAWGAEDRPHCYVCGPTGFVETVASTLVELGHEPERVRTERFGPTGG